MTFMYYTVVSLILIVMGFVTRDFDIDGDPGSNIEHIQDVVGTVLIWFGSTGLLLVFISRVSSMLCG